MARKLRPETVTRTVPGFRPKSLEARFVDEATFRDYHKRRRDIERLWPACFFADAETSRDIAGMRRNALDALRAEMRAAISTGISGYLIAI